MIYTISQSLDLEELKSKLPDLYLVLSFMQESDKTTIEYLTKDEYIMQCIKELHDKLGHSTLDNFPLNILNEYPLWQSAKEYQSGAIVSYNGETYKCIKSNTSSIENTPDSSEDWKNTKDIINEQTSISTLMLYTAQFVVTDDVALTIPDIYPEWSADSVAYKLNEKVRYNDLLYKCLTAHTSQASWTPTDAPSLWVRIDDPAEEWPEWRQPTGSTDAYAKGAKVAHNSKHWVSNVDNNTWEPGVYGWDEQTDTSAS